MSSSSLSQRVRLNKCLREIYISGCSLLCLDFVADLLYPRLLHEVNEGGSIDGSIGEVFDDRMTQNVALVCKRELRSVWLSRENRAFLQKLAYLESLLFVFFDVVYCSVGGS